MTPGTQLGSYELFEPIVRICTVNLSAANHQGGLTG